MSDKFEGKIGRTLADSEPWWPDPPRPPGDAPNVVMIVLDDTGFAHFGCFGSTIETPNIDRLAANGVRYSNFHTTALCSPSAPVFSPGAIITPWACAPSPTSTRASPTCAAASRRARPRWRSCCARPDTRRIPSASGTWRHGRVQRRRPARQLAPAEGLRPLLRLPAGRDRPVLPGADVDNHHILPRPGQMTATTSPRT